MISTLVSWIVVCVEAEPDLGMILFKGWDINTTPCHKFNIYFQPDEERLSSD